MIQPDISIGSIISISLITFIGMEFVAWAAHRYLMHGFLWFLHEDHHRVEKGFFQKNDFFFLLFAVPSWLCLMLGAIFGNWSSMAAGFGILLYGITYFLFHEVLVHKRFPKIRKAMFRTPMKRYFRAIELAHKAHHKHLDRNEGESFGLMVFHPKHYRAAK
jgi:beta-carotene 3-hydroxylase